MKSVSYIMHGFDDSISIDIAPLSVIYLKYVPKKKTVEKTLEKKTEKGPEKASVKKHTKHKGKSSGNVTHLIPGLNYNTDIKNLKSVKK